MLSQDSESTTPRTAGQAGYTSGNYSTAAILIRDLATFVFRIVSNIKELTSLIKYEQESKKTLQA
ncbi:unnamed protein product [Acanthoscelides obtectus]|uniref:Uncharacterized protein n=1 Tax=Acanthoscelides obtectus TaxID=200917 RepID=A0A9P0LLJ3_ACAOB|nr:unnamed protein product [Acanthoscelides obtectus]CAK1681251.1 hypothetical protein AOBTE_LOCUS33080 [Acanthoscelides obtectus]